MSDQERWAKYEAEGLAMHTPEFERDIAETTSWRRDLAMAKASRRAERREAIATTALTGMLAIPGLVDFADPGFLQRDLRQRLAENCVMLADALIDELDAAEARDAEATK